MRTAQFTSLARSVIVIFLALVVLVGCGSKPSDPGDDQLSSASQSDSSAPRAVSTLSVEEAVQATVQADQQARAQAAEETRIAQFTPTPTPLSEEDFNKEVEKSLARATAVASVYQSVVFAEEAEGATRLLGSSISPNGKLVAAAYDRHDSTRYVLWQASDGKIVAKIDARSDNINYADPAPIAFSPDGQYMALLNKTGQGSNQTDRQKPFADVYSITNWQPVMSLGSELDSFYGLRYTADGKHILAIGDDGWEWFSADTGKRVLGDRTSNTDIVVGDDGNAVVTIPEWQFGGLGIRGSDLPDSTSFEVLPDTRSGSAALSGEGRFLFTLVDGEWAKWDLPSGDKVAVLASGVKRPFVAARDFDQVIAVCPAGDCAAVGTEDPVTRESRILLHSESAGDKLLQPPTLRSGIFDLVFHPDGKVLFASGHDNGSGVVTAWDVNTGEQLIELPTGMAHSLDLSADGSVLVVDSRQFWHLGEWLATLEAEQ